MDRMHETLVKHLLGRAPVDFDRGDARARWSGRRVLLTGAAGSLGAALLDPLAGLEPAEVVLLDRAETPLFELVRRARARRSVRWTPALVDLCDERALADLFETRAPELVLHAAAYKHVPLLESHPHAALRNNLQATRALATQCQRHGVHLIHVSTDKAVAPVSVMGASKRACELDLLGRRQRDGLRVDVVRLGNVLGSRGSVLPIWCAQLERGDPLTVTHPEMTRFFVTPAEAAGALLQVSCGDGGGLGALEIAGPVRVLELARRLLAWHQRDPDDIELTGPRPGERLTERLYTAEESPRPGPLPHMVALAPPEAALEAFEARIEALLASDRSARALLTALVPAFQRQRSEGEGV